MREIEDADADGIFKLESDPRVHAYLGKKPIHTMKQALSIIERIKMQYRDNGIGRWAVVDRKSNAFMGWAGLKYERELREELDYFDLGYRIRPRYWSQGIATECALQLLHYGFENKGLAEICASAEVGNGASNHILRKIGMSFVETFEFKGMLVNFYKMERSSWIDMSPKIDTSPKIDSSEP